MGGWDKEPSYGDPTPDRGLRLRTWIVIWIVVSAVGVWFLL